MATTTHIAAPARLHNPLALWHLLSLDAPTVAAFWTWFIARCGGVRLPASSPIAMALAVWIVYASDRLLDAARSERTGDHSELEARHRFHHRHRRTFAICIVAAAIGLGALLPLLDASAVKLYLLEGVLLMGWLTALHSTRSAHRMPKEIAVGIFFSAAVFIPTITRNPAMRSQLAPVALLLAGLGALNCLFIDGWEHENFIGTQAIGLRSGKYAHIPAKFALNHIAAFAFAIALSGIAAALFVHSAARFVAGACSLSAILLLGLNRSRTALSPIHLRAAADLALLTPLLLLPLMLSLPR